MKFEHSIFNQFGIKLCLKSVFIGLILLMSLHVFAEEIPEDIKLAIEKELVSKIDIKRPKVDESSSKVFRAPIYQVKPVLGYIAVIDGEIQYLNKPVTSLKLPAYIKLIRDDFVLDSLEKAKMLANAVQPIIPYKLKTIIDPVKVDHGWIIFRGKFFKSYSGLIFNTDEKGKITLVEFVLKINPKDYSYTKPEYSS